MKNENPMYLVAMLAVFALIIGFILSRHVRFVEKRINFNTCVSATKDRESCMRLLYPEELEHRKKEYDSWRRKVKELKE